MSQNTLKVHDLNEDAEFDENGVEVFDEKAFARNPANAGAEYRSAVPQVSKHLSERPVSSEAGLFLLFGKLVFLSPG